MHIEELQDYCMTKNGVTAQFPFDEVTLVFKVMGKIFCLAGLDRFERGEPSINLKCDPEKAVVLREHYDGAVIPGYHASKKHWNTVLLNRDIPQKELRTWIDHSYDLVASKLTRAEKESLKNL
jgi:predicted DNA-binding protein (MmcQ/YjbR family)